MILRRFFGIEPNYTPPQEQDNQQVAPPQPSPAPTAPQRTLEQLRGDAERLILTSRAGLTPDIMVEALQVLAIHEEVSNMGEESWTPRTSYTLKGLVERHLPDTIRAYLKAPGADNARMVLDTLEQMEETLIRIREAASYQNQTEFEIQVEFLARQLGENIA